MTLEDLHGRFLEQQTTSGSEITALGNFLHVKQQLLTVSARANSPTYQFLVIKSEA